jgi:hypothetical protein
MKRVLLITVIAVFALSSFGQKIKTDEVDKFTKERIVETSFEKIVSDKSPLGSTGGRLMKNIWVAFRQVGDVTFLRLKWCTNQVLALSENADIIFLDSDGNTYTFKNTDFTVSGQGEGTVGAFGSALYGLNIYMVGDCSVLKDKTITDMRIHLTDGYMDFQLNKKDAKVLADTFALFESALKN